MSLTLDDGATALAVISPSAVSIIVAADDNDILGKLKAELGGYTPDATTEPGRLEARSKARKVGVAKQDMIRLADALKDDAQKLIKSVNGEVNVVKERMDGLRDSILAPVKAFEDRESERVKAHQDALDRLQESPHFYTAQNPSEELRRRLEWLQSQPPRDWQEFAPRAASALASEIALTAGAIAVAERRDADAAELLRRRAEDEQRAREDAARQQAERERRIATEAAEQAKRDAETRAERERQETLRAAAEDRARIERERQAAEDRAAMAERHQAAAEAKAKADAAEAAKRAETARLKAEQQAVWDRDAAVAAEKKRVADEQAAFEAERVKRAANKAHKGSINKAALDALLPVIAERHSGNAVEGEAIAMAIVAAIAKGTIPAVTIHY